MEKLFTFENADDFRQKLVSKLNFPYVSCQISTLGGKENISILLCISLDSKENWYNGIKENSSYYHFHISNTGIVKNFSKQYNLKHIRKFKSKNINHLIKKLNNIKEGV